MKSRFLVFCLLFAAFINAARATEVTDLGLGLGYLRVQALGDVLKALHPASPLVLDLRHATTTPEAAEAFNLTLAARNPVDATLLILVGPDTPAKLGEVLQADSARTVVLGVEQSVLSPDVVVDQTAEDDRRAYEALDHGTPLADLISGKIEKERFDEAALVQEFKNGNRDPWPAGNGHEPAKATDAAPEAKPAPAGNPAAPGNGAPTPAKLTDRVLQRAVNLHRALLATKR